MHSLLVMASAASVALAAAAAGNAPHWSYEGEGAPDHWMKLSSDFVTCGAGKMQSPIDLQAVNARGATVVATNYQTSPLTVLNNGHTVQANFAAGSKLISGGREFGLVQVHFHTLSEHAVSGKRYPLEAHFVHADSAGKLAVLGIFFEEGAANAELSKLIAAAPKHKQDATPVAGVQFDPNGLLPPSLNVYRYMGSLTTPPCTEGVNWHVADKAITASKEQIAALHVIMGDNARPLQPANNRLIVGR
ncbi:MAG: carbonic anhydrase family protein [Sphingobium sp.]